jgi:hypothetical protein
MTEHGAALFGRLGRFPVGHRLRRWDPDYRDGHVVFAETIKGFRPGHVTERFEGQTSFQDCGPTSAIMLARSNYGSNAIPDTKAEVLAFRRQAGATSNGFTSNAQLERGLKSRYNVTVQMALRFPAIHAAMGSPAQYRWFDPLAPKTWRDRYGKTHTYVGDLVTPAEVSTFLGGPYATIGRTGLIASIKAAVTVVTAEDPMLLAFVARYTLNGGVKLYAHPADSSPVAATVPAGSYAVTASGTPFNGTGLNTAWRAVTWTTTYPDGKSAPKLVYVHAADCKPA